MLFINWFKFFYYDYTIEIQNFRDYKLIAEMLHRDLNLALELSRKKSIWDYDGLIYEYKKIPVPKHKLDYLLVTFFLKDF